MYNKYISLSDNQKQLIYGSLLGDGYFNFNKGTLKIEHSEKQYQYLLWKYNLLELTTKISKQNKQLNTDKVYTTYSLSINRTYLTDVLSDIYKQLYSNTSHRKKLSMQFLNNLSHLGLAVWWLDDGCLSVHKGNRYGKLCTHAFNYEEHILMQKYFAEVWGIDTTITVEKHKYYFLRFNVKALQRLISIIYKDVCEIPSLLYKINLNYENQVNLNRFYDGFDEIYLYIQDEVGKFNDCDS